ncbi:MAG: dihydrolipoamide succinyltransferase, partial [Spirosomaceae bacterium]|nr:dihydrolipoamide succinyltransferase [Spirosomataceae bacterium]
AVVEINAKIATIQVGASNGTAKTDTATVTEKPAAQSSGSSESYAANHPSPAAAKILEEKGIDPKSVSG